MGLARRRPPAAARHPAGPGRGGHRRPAARGRCRRRRRAWLALVADAGRPLAGHEVKRLLVAGRCPPRPRGADDRAAGGVSAAGGCLRHADRGLHPERRPALASRSPTSPPSGSGVELPKPGDLRGPQHAAVRGAPRRRRRGPSWRRSSPRPGLERLYASWSCRSSRSSPTWRRPAWRSIGRPWAGWRRPSPPRSGGWRTEIYEPSATSSTSAAPSSSSRCCSTS